MPEWTISIETDFDGLDVDGLERFGDAFERGFGYMGPATALHDGKLSFTVTVTAPNAQEALTDILSAANAALAEALAGDLSSLAQAMIDKAKGLQVAHARVDRELVRA